MNKKVFDRITKKCADIVKTWPKWKRNILINCHTVTTGKYIIPSKKEEGEEMR